MKKVEKLFQKTELTIQMPEERRDPPTPSSQEQPTTENGLEASETVMVHRGGQMVPVTKANGKTTEPMAKASLFILTEMSMMESGSTTKQMDTVSIITLMELSTKATGEMIFSTVKERNRGQTAQSTKANTSEARSMELDFTAGTTEASTKVTGMKTKLKDSVLTVGLMEDSIKVNGLTTIWTAWASTPGLMEGVTWANTKTIRNMATESTNGPTEDSISAVGCVANSTGSAFTKQQILSSNMVSGKKASALNGLKDRQSTRYKMAQKTSVCSSKNQKTCSNNYTQALRSRITLMKSSTKYKRSSILHLTTNSTDDLINVYSKISNQQ